MAQSLVHNATLATIFFVFREDLELDFCKHVYAFVRELFRPHVVLGGGGEHSSGFRTAELRTVLD